MKPRRAITPHMTSSDMTINARLTIMKIHKRLREIDPAHKPASRYQARLMHKRAARRTRSSIVR
ncbi:MAG: hypothetical protein WC208_14530 [Gallionella sp.]